MNATAMGLSVAGGVVLLIIIGLLGYKYYPFGYPWGYKRRTLSAPADAVGDSAQTPSSERRRRYKPYEPDETLSAPATADALTLSAPAPAPYEPVQTLTPNLQPKH